MTRKDSISLPPKLDQLSRGSSKREENRTLVSHLKLGTWISGCEVQEETLKLTEPRRRKHSALVMGLFGICSGDASSWDQQSLLPPLVDLEPTYCRTTSPLHISCSELEQLL